jgi:hypothetical protein
MQQSASSVQDRDSSRVCGGQYTLVVHGPEDSGFDMLLECDLRQHHGRCRMEWNKDLILFFDKENSESGEKGRESTAKTAGVSG